MRSYTYIVAIAVLTVLAACAKKENGATAQTPQNCNVPGINCNTQIYSQQGWSVPAPIPYNTVQTNGYCGCPAGTRPVYNPAWGIGCAPGDAYGYSVYVGYSTVYSGGSYVSPQNSMPINQPQQYYSGINPGGNCQNNFAFSCDVRTGSAQCGAGGVCRPIGGASVLGVCSNSNGVDNWNVNNGYYNSYQNYNLPYGYPVNTNWNYNTGFNSNCQLRTHQTNWGGWYQTWECNNSGANGVPR